MLGFTGMEFPFRFSGSGGVAKSTTSMEDFSHIKESIIQIILTSIGEREFETQFGSEVRSQLFKGYEDETELSILQFNISQALETWEPRISINDIELEPLDDGDGSTFLQCTIFYEVTQYMTSDSVTFDLNF